jgi:hypothetical protein
MESKVFKGPDVKGKRFRPEVHHIMDQKFFNAFREKHKRFKDVSDKDLRTICNTFHKVFWETVIDTRDGVELPENIGHIFIGTCQTSKKKNIDFAKSTKYGVIVTNNNWDTDGKLAKIFYTTLQNKYRFSNRECWAFNGCRLFKRGVAKTYSTNWPIYIQVDPMKKIRKMFEYAIKKNYAQDRDNKRLETYNEFDI